MSLNLGLSLATNIDIPADTARMLKGRSRIQKRKRSQKNAAEQQKSCHIDNEVEYVLGS